MRHAIRNPRLQVGAEFLQGNRSSRFLLLVVEAEAAEEAAAGVAAVTTILNCLAERVAAHVTKRVGSFAGTGQWKSKKERVRFV